MATFQCSRYPQLRIGSVATFTNGVCETTNAEAVAQLRKFAGNPEYGITEVGRSAPTGGGKQADEGAKAPAKSAAKGEWVAWAVRCGVLEEEASEMTRDQLAAEFGAASPNE